MGTHVLHTSIHANRHTGTCACTYTHAHGPAQLGHVLAKTQTLGTQPWKSSHKQASQREEVSIVASCAAEALPPILQARAGHHRSSTSRVGSGGCLDAGGCIRMLEQVAGQGHSQHRGRPMAKDMVRTHSPQARRLPRDPVPCSSEEENENRASLQQSNGCRLLLGATVSIPGLPWLHSRREG